MSGIGDFAAAERNKQPIFDGLAGWLEDASTVLEISSGDGTHARHALKRLPHIRWQASEAPAHLRRLVAALADVRNARLLPPVALDVRGAWPRAQYDAVFAANVAHIMGMEAVAALFVGAAGHLPAGGPLGLYGPFFSSDETPGAGNLAFDRALRGRDPAMGIRALEALDELAVESGLELAARVAMPTDNRLLIWRRV